MNSEVLSDDTGLASDRWVYRTYRRVDLLREILERADAAVGRNHGSETSAVLGSVVDAVFGDDPRTRGERIRVSLEGAFVRHGISADALGLEGMSTFLGEFLIGIGAHCAQVARQDGAAAFSACVDESLPTLTEVYVEALARRTAQARSE